MMDCLPTPYINEIDGLANGYSMLTAGCCLVVIGGVEAAHVQLFIEGE
jgi:hypothetical protein